MSAADGMQTEGHCLTNIALWAANWMKTAMCQECVSRCFTYSIRNFLVNKNLCIIYTSFELTQIQFFPHFLDSFCNSKEHVLFLVKWKFLSAKHNEMGRDCHLWCRHKIELNEHTFWRAWILPPFVYGKFARDVFNLVKRICMNFKAILMSNLRLTRVCKGLLECANKWLFIIIFNSIRVKFIHSNNTILSVDFQSSNF